MMINSGVSKEEVLTSFMDLNLQTNEKSPDTPKDAVEDLLGQPSGKFDYKVFILKHLPMTFPLSQLHLEDGAKILMMKYC